jgi:quinol monooxygenase YgiN
MSLSTFVVVARINLLPGVLGAFLPIAAADARDSLALEAGCMAFDILVPDHDETYVMFHEVYQDQAAFDLHLIQPHYYAFKRAAEHFMAGEPEIAFFGAYKDSAPLDS